MEKTVGPNHVEYAEVQNSMGLVLKKRADYAGAEKLYEVLLAIDFPHKLESFSNHEENVRTKGILAFFLNYIVALQSWTYS